MYFVVYIYQIITETTPSHKQAGICRNMTHRYVNFCLFKKSQPIAMFKCKIYDLALYLKAELNRHIPMQDCI